MGRRADGDRADPADSGHRALVYARDGSVRFTATRSRFAANATRDDVVAVLPETLRIDASLDAERRQRGIYEAMVYTSQVALKGRFAPPEIAAPVGRTIDVHWDDATLAVGISAPVGIHDVEPPLISGGSRAAEPGSLLACAAARHALAPARCARAGGQR